MLESKLKELEKSSPFLVALAASVIISTIAVVVIGAHHSGIWIP